MPLPWRGISAAEAAVLPDVATDLAKLKEDAKKVVNHDSMQQAMEEALQTCRAATRVEWLQHFVREVVTSKQARRDPCGGAPSAVSILLQPLACKSNLDWRDATPRHSAPACAHTVYSVTRMHGKGKPFRSERSLMPSDGSCEVSEGFACNRSPLLCGCTRSCHIDGEC